MSADLESIERLAADLVARGREHVHVLAWRDLDDPDAGGSEEHADQFMSRWAAAGLRITHRTSKVRGAPASVLRNGYRVDRRGGRLSVFPRTVVDEVFGRLGARDAVVEVWNGMPWFSPVWRRCPGITFFHHVHGPMWDQILPPPGGAMGRLLETRLAPPFYRRTPMVTPSTSTREELIGLGFGPSMVTAVDNGVDEFFTPGGVRSASPLVVAVGRLAPVKRHAEVIRAANQARVRCPDLRLVLVGEGPLRPELERQIEQMGAGEWVSLAGRVDRTDLRDLYRRAWVVVSASLAEGWGLTLTEAAACGTPAVATDISGHRCSVQDGVTGVLSPLEHLGETLGAVLADRVRRDALGVAAHERAGRLTWDASARGILEVLHSAVAGRQHVREDDG